MKVKNFVYNADFSSRVENELNEFIKNKKVIDIKHSLGGDGQGTVVISALVMYEED